MKKSHVISKSEMKEAQLNPKTVFTPEELMPENAFKYLKKMGMEQKKIKELRKILRILGKFSYSQELDPSKVEVVCREDSVYIGELDPITGLKQGIGILVTTEGRMYEGEWRRDQKHGYGREIVLNEFYFIGNWYDDRRSGTGKMTLSDGTTKEGCWSRYSRSKFLITYPDGRQVHSGS
uniref:MORN repeat-containing protein n=1 Tax=Euplotes harpa TaxID=151035 RepID=A0A7S3JK39_9SPIT